MSVFKRLSALTELFCKILTQRDLGVYQAPVDYTQRITHSGYTQYLLYTIETGKDILSLQCRQAGRPFLHTKDPAQAGWLMYKYI